MEPSSETVPSALGGRASDRLNIWLGAIGFVGLVGTMALIAEGAVAWAVGSYLGAGLAGWILLALLALPTLRWLFWVYLPDTLDAEREIARREAGLPPTSEPS